MRVINLLIFILSAFAVFQTARLFIQERTSFRTALFWSLVWLAIGIFGLFPALLDYIMVPTMMKQRLFFVVVIAILILYALSFRQGSENAEVKRKLGRLAQEISLLRYELQDSVKSKDKEGSDSPQDTHPKSHED